MKKRSIFGAVVLVLVLSVPALGAPLAPTSYDMLNGETGSWQYWDKPYPATANLQPLSGGKGHLTDGVLAGGHWYQVAGVNYVGWTNIDPKITFHFADIVSVDQVGIHVDNTLGYGDVRYPASVVIQMGAVIVNATITPDPFYDSKWFYFDTTGLSGDTLELTLFRDSGNWMMLDEVSFNGTPTPLPPGLLLMGTGLLGLLGWRSFRQG